MAPGPLARAWHAWKALRLPWRKRFFVGEPPPLMPPAVDSPPPAARGASLTPARPPGYDLEGNTYWQFRLTTRGPPPPPVDAAAAAAADVPAEPWRRVVRCARARPHHSDVRVSPLWHQWLRHARRDAPSLAEQRDDVRRQDRLRLLAAQADARWEAKPRLAAGPVHALPPDPPLRRPGPRAAVAPPDGSRGAPGEDWQPASWTPR